MLYSFGPCSTEGTGKLEHVQKAVIKIVKRLTHEMKDMMRELGLFSLEKKSRPVLPSPMQWGVIQRVEADSSQASTAKGQQATVTKRCKGNSK